MSNGNGPKGRNFGYHSGEMLNSNDEIVQIGDIIESSGNNSNSAFGLNGGEYIADTNLHQPPSGKAIVAIQVITTCSITLTGNITGITGVSLTVGVIIYGKYTRLTLGSGSVIAYYGVI